MQDNFQTNDQADQSYDWAAYYESAYHELREKNIQAVLKIDQEQNSVETLTNALHFINGNRFWNAMTPVRRICDRIDAIRHPAPAVATEELIDRYEKEVFELKHRYQMWVQKVEPTRMEFYTNESCVEKSYTNENASCLDAFYFVKLEEGTISEQASRVWAYYLAKYPDAVLAYADEDFLAEEQRMEPWFKPCWSPETLLAFFYFGSYFAIRKTQVHQYMDETAFLKLCKEAADHDMDALVKLYELVLQCSHLCDDKQIVHVGEVLFHRIFDTYTEEQLQLVTANRNWDRLQRIEAVLQKQLECGSYMWGFEAAFNDMKVAYLTEHGVKAHMETAMDPAAYHVVYDVDEPLVSVVILSKDHPDVLELCLKSLRERTEYKNLELIVVDNGSNEENKTCVETLKNKYRFNYLYTPMDFNFSAQCNMGVEISTGELILLLNDDVEVFEKSWLTKMVGQAMQDGIGAVGARLLYAGTNKIQHAGITNLAVGPSHKLIACPDDINYYYGRNRVTYNMLGVTAACLLVKREKYQEICGLNEDMRVAYNDVDFCFKLYEKGYRNVLRNDAVLYHYESFSRGLDAMDRQKWTRLLAEKKRLYDAHPTLKGQDPYYHELLADDSSQYRINYRIDAEDKNKFASLKRFDASKLAKENFEPLKLQVDKAELQLHEEDEKPDYYCVSGWSYFHGDDQCKYKKHLLFKNQKSEIWDGLFFIEYRKDVEEMLFAEKNVATAGFCTRFVKGSLESGVYEIGMLYEDVMSGKTYVTWSEKTLEII